MCPLRSRLAPPILPLLATLLLAVAFAPALHAQDTLRVRDIVLVAKAISSPNPVGGPPYRSVEWHHAGADRATPPALRLVTFAQDEDDNSKSWRKGTARVARDTIWVWTLWGFSGEAVASPRGAMRECYLPDGPLKPLKRISAEIYLEDGMAADGRHYLHHRPADDAERATFRKYVARISQEHKAKFVYGAQADALLAAAREALGR